MACEVVGVKTVRGAVKIVGVEVDGVVGVASKDGVASKVRRVNKIGVMMDDQALEGYSAGAANKAEEVNKVGVTSRAGTVSRDGAQLVNKDGVKATVGGQARSREDGK
ncbi:hypothetical protein Tcan_03251 [Toxocara canis]|uniref:Uncharacterized protein n=2 Tax=Toxocara canis TaxID=6265 RepID=A0A0B2VFN3_TOXCA|nr:hypothetical protein Tcan_03251 [Toxocara canis]VDM46683.1 unnamed protein product [Toxocara canis]